MLNGIKLLGLLDSGANCSILGQGALQTIENIGLQLKQMHSSIKTVDGSIHPVKFYVNSEVEYNGQTRCLTLLVVPTLKKKLVLGMDFWNLFKIVPTVCEVEQSIESERVDMSVEEKNKLEEIISLFPETKNDRLGRTTLYEHVIDTGEAVPFQKRYYPVSPYVQVEINKELDRMIKLDVIEPASSPWSNPLVCVSRTSGKIRLCLDARQLNSVTVKESYPLPYITRILGRLDGTRYLSSIDLSDAFWQVPLEVSSRPKTAFVVPGRGLFQFKAMPFGLCNAAQSLCRLMDNVLGYDLEPAVFVYLDDIIVATETIEDHFKMLKIVAERLTNAGLTINIDKSKFCVKFLKYLGFIVDKNGLNTDPDKIRAIVDFPVPKCVKDVRRLLGMTEGLLLILRR